MSLFKRKKFYEKIQISTVVKTCTVLILILLEDTLWKCKKSGCKLHFWCVVILFLMEKLYEAQMFSLHYYHGTNVLILILLEDTL